MLSAPVTSASDLTIVALSVHYRFPSPIPLTPTLELPVTVLWPPGAALNQNKLSQTVLHRGLPVALDGHDCGYWILHISLPPVPFNTLEGMHSLFSSRKMLFSSSAVKVDGAQVACHAYPLFPMSQCADPCMIPGALATNMLNSVHVGIPLGDFIIGALAAAATMLVDYALRKPPEGAPKVEDLLNKLFIPLWGDKKKVPANLLKMLLKTVMGLVSGVLKIYFMGDGQLRFKLGSDFNRIGANYFKSHDGSTKREAYLQFGLPGPVPQSIRVKRTRTSPAHGPSKDEWVIEESSGVPSPLGGGVEQRTTVPIARDGTAGPERRVTAVEPGSGQMVTQPWGEPL
jgi:hypothetical protein